jgi:hypothetical protein
MNRIAINAAAYSRKGDALQALLDGQFQTGLVGRDQQTGFFMPATAVDRSDGVNDVASL